MNVTSVIGAVAQIGRLSRAWPADRDRDRSLHGYRGLDGAAHGKALGVGDVASGSSHRVALDREPSPEQRKKDSGHSGANGAP